MIPTPIVANRASCVTYSLMEISALIDPHVILQSDNGREFSIMVRHSSDHDSTLDGHFIDDVISKTKKVWPEVLMVGGSPC